MLLSKDPLDKGLWKALQNPEGSADALKLLLAPVVPRWSTAIACYRSKPWHPPTQQLAQKRVVTSFPEPKFGCDVVPPVLGSPYEDALTT